MRIAGIASLLAVAAAGAFPGVAAAQEAAPDSVPSEPIHIVDIRPSEPIPTDSLVFGLSPADTIPVLAPRFREGRGARDLAAVPTEDVLPKNPRNAAIRSFLIPGWGQFYTGHPWRGVLFAAAELGLFYAGWDKHQEALDKEEEIREARAAFLEDPPEGAPEDSLALVEQFRDTAEFRQLDAELSVIEERREDYYAWGLLSVIFAAVDAYTAAQLDPIDIGGEPSERRVWAGLRWRLGPGPRSARADPAGPR
ncbi:MAG: DUF5683 domain-containing protein [Gemmatimonadota bacterium]|nr:DUF5683 domain-containing protein [Gemmatimonadota bacterium]